MPKRGTEPVFCCRAACCAYERRRGFVPEGGGRPTCAIDFYRFSLTRSWHDHPRLARQQGKIVILPEMMKNIYIMNREALFFLGKKLWPKLPDRFSSNFTYGTGWVPRETSLNIFWIRGQTRSQITKTKIFADRNSSSLIFFHSLLLKRTRGTLRSPPQREKIFIFF